MLAKKKGPVVSIACFKGGMACQKSLTRIHQIHRPGKRPFYFSISTTVHPSEGSFTDISGEYLKGSMLDNPIFRTLNLTIVDKGCGQTRLFSSDNAQVTDEVGMLASDVLDNFSGAAGDEKLQRFVANQQDAYSKLSVPESQVCAAKISDGRSPSINGKGSR